MPDEYTPLPYPLLFGLLFVGFLAGLPSLAHAQPAIVEGDVHTSDGTGVPYANVRIDGTTDGTATDENGHFRFRSRETGQHLLHVSAVGFTSAERSVQLGAGDTTTVQVTLRSSTMELEEAVVVGETYSTGTGEQTTLEPLEAVTTPGAAGDLFRAFQAFPGVASPGDGAGLFVRGGDVTETKTVIDQATVYHPYRYESPARGTFGAVPSFLVDGTQFSTGGFSAQYGDALSGVLAMESKNRPEAAQQYVSLGLAGASVSLDQPLVANEFGLRASGNRSFTGLLFRINGQHDDYATVPQGTEGNLSLVWDYSDTSQLKLFGFARHNRLGVETARGSYSGVYRSQETSQLYSLQWTTNVDAWTVESSASWSPHVSERTFGVLDLSPTEDTGNLRADATRNGQKWTFRAGGTVERREYELEGAFPTQPNVLTSDAPTRSVHEAIQATRTGGYAELEARMLSPLLARVGLRTDHHTRAEDLVVDPRVVIAWQFGARTYLRTAWGLYHQFPELETYGEHSGENVLSAQRAQHLVVGLRHERDNLLLRAEAYHKPYRNLVIRTGSSRFANVGTGFAQGIDVFAKYGSFLGSRFNGWASYSLLQSHRTQPRNRGTEVQLEQGPAPFDLTHQITAVGKIRVIDEIRVGGTYRYTTGQPFTPVLGRTQIDSGTFLPIDGPVGSKRLPAYQRLDLQVSYFWPFNRQQNVVFYASLNNAFDRENVVGVMYTPDYSERRDRTTNFRRSVYVGLSLTL